MTWGESSIINFLAQFIVIIIFNLHHNVRLFVVMCFSTRMVHRLVSPTLVFYFYFIWMNETIFFFKYSPEALRCVENRIYHNTFVDNFGGAFVTSMCYCGCWWLHYQNVSFRLLFRFQVLSVCPMPIIILWTMQCTTTLRWTIVGKTTKEEARHYLIVNFTFHWLFKHKTFYVL